MNTGVYGLNAQFATPPRALLGRPTPVPLTAPLSAVQAEPRTIPGLLAWYDASRTETLSQNSNGTSPAAQHNDPVGRWNDLGPFGYHMTQTTNNNRPLLQINSQGGLPSVLFDGSNDWLINGARYTHGLMPTTFCVFQMQQDLAHPNLQTTISSGRAGGPNNEVVYAVGIRSTYSNPANQIGAFSAGGIGRRNGTSNILVGSSPTLFMIATTIDGTPINVTNNPADGVVMGAVRDSNGSLTFANFRFCGRIAEIVVYNRRLAIGECVAVENHLAAKWNITLR